ncbi:MAG TPA: ROK family protein [Acidimicrobiales bacterium]|nr:ROK family protein [Acidimicrobiales bacterium]
MEDTPESASTPATYTPTPVHPFTLAFDIGGTDLKASVLGKNGDLVAEQVKVPTTYPLPPDLLVEKLTVLAAKLPEPDRISAGFPGKVRNGHVLTAPHFVRTKGPETRVDPKLAKAWSHFDLATALSEAIGKPCRVANDADVQGAAVVSGRGFEAVFTLGTGFGRAFFLDGRLLPNEEFSLIEFFQGETFNEQLGEPIRKKIRDKRWTKRWTKRVRKAITYLDALTFFTFNEQLGEPTRKKIGDKRWNKRVRKAIAYLDALTFFDHLYIGGGNAPRINRRDLGEVLERITVVDNTAGILGGIKLWEGDHLLGV